MNPHWLTWAKKLQEIAQNGLLYNRKPYRDSVFDVERFEQVRNVASEIMAHHTDADAPYITNLFAKEEGHATPKIDLRAVVFQGDKILLVKERSDGGWTLPGGWADVNETPAQGVVRETWEESGYEVKAVKLLAFLDKSKHDHPPSAFHTFKAIFLCELISGQATTNIEIDEIGFFGENELPPLSIERVTGGQLRRVFEHHRNKDLWADFD
ncbi:MAG: NUDIX hydrolase [Chloroflexota bacterium]